MLFLLFLVFETSFINSPLSSIFSPLSSIFLVIIHQLVLEPKDLILWSLLSPTHFILPLYMHRKKIFHRLLLLSTICTKKKKNLFCCLVLPLAVIHHGYPVHHHYTSVQIVTNSWSSSIHKRAAVHQHQRCYLSASSSGIIHQRSLKQPTLAPLPAIIASIHHWSTFLAGVVSIHLPLSII